MSVYTKIGSALWMWSPFRRLERGPDDIIGRCAKLLWLALYTAPEAKMSVPGLFAGSIATIADTTGFPPDETRRYLDRLIEDDLVEFDVERRVLRLVVLPDAGESPTNGNTIRGWWRKFQNIPACAVRDAHVPMLFWLMQEWSRSTDKAISADHMKAWGETFGRVSVPAPRPRPRKHVQTSLFVPPYEASEPFRESADIGSEPSSAPLSPSDPDFNKIRDSGTLPEPFGKERDPDQRSGSGSGSQSSGSGERPGPRLVLVPPATEPGLAELLFDIAAGAGLAAGSTEVREGAHAGLRATIAQLAAADCTPEERIAMGAWARSRCLLAQVSGDPRSKLSVWVAIPGAAIEALEAVRKRAAAHRDVQDQIAAALT